MGKVSSGAGMHPYLKPVFVFDFQKSEIKPGIGPIMGDEEFKKFRELSKKGLIFNISFFQLSMLHLNNNFYDFSKIEEGYSFTVEKDRLLRDYEFMTGWDAKTMYNFTTKFNGKVKFTKLNKYLWIAEQI